MVTHQQNLLSVEEKVKVIREIGNGKKESDVCQGFRLVNSSIRGGKTEPKYSCL